MMYPALLPLMRSPRSRLNGRPWRFKWTRPFRRKTKSGFWACAITFQTQSTDSTQRPSIVTQRINLKRQARFVQQAPRILMVITWMVILMSLFLIFPCGPQSKNTNCKENRFITAILMCYIVKLFQWKASPISRLVSRVSSDPFQVQSSVVCF